MSILQEQISVLSQKVEELTHRIEQLSTRLSDVVSECRFGSEQIKRADGLIGNYRGPMLHSDAHSSLEHKDILTDDGGLDGQSGDRLLSPEIQIQRLTAQLTAAYNRIAALEEQLLSKKRVQQQ